MINPSTLRCAIVAHFSNKFIDEAMVVQIDQLKLSKKAQGHLDKVS